MATIVITLGVFIVIEAILSIVVRHQNMILLPFTARVGRVVVGLSLVLVALWGG